MTALDIETATRPVPDQVLADIAAYACDYTLNSEPASETAFYCLMDSLTSGLEALRHPACTRLLGPVVPGATMAGGARVPGTSYELDPVQAAFNIGTMVRWLDSNDTGLAAEWGHPSDNLGGILAVADYLSRKAVIEGGSPPTVGDLTDAVIRAHQIQGVIALENSCSRLGPDPVLRVRVASAAVATRMLGGGKAQVINALSNAWMDGGMPAGRHARDAGSRKRWTAGDATSRGLRHALMAVAGQTEYPSASSVECPGFDDALPTGKCSGFPQSHGSYLIEHARFRIGFPVESHAQTAVECAMKLHEDVSDRLAEIDHVMIETQAPAVRTTDKTGGPDNAAERGHCIRYMVAIPLIFGRLDATDYEDSVALDPRVDELRRKMRVREKPLFTEQYFVPEKRNIANAVQVFFRDGTVSRRVQVEIPVGHPGRRDEGIPALKAEFEASVDAWFATAQAEKVKALFLDRKALEMVPVSEFVSVLVRN